MKVQKNKNNTIYRNKYIISTIAIVLFFLFVIKYLNLNQNFIGFFKQSLTIKPESYSELYFDNNGNLPSKVVPNHLYTFEFSIHNLENKDMTYPFEVYLLAGKSKLLIDKKTVTIKNNQYQTVDEGFIVNAPLIRSEIVVNLINKNQQIDLWLTGTGANEKVQ